MIIAKIKDYIQAILGIMKSYQSRKTQLLSKSNLKSFKTKAKDHLIVLFAKCNCAKEIKNSGFGKRFHEPPRKQLQDIQWKL